MRSLTLIAVVFCANVAVAAPDTHRPWFTSKSKDVALEEPTAQIRKPLSRSRGFYKPAERRVARPRTVTTRRVTSRTARAPRPTTRTTRRRAVSAAEPKAVVNTQPLEADRPNADDVKDNPGTAVAKQAMRYNGTDYRFGGKSKEKGFDCSGFVLRIFNDLKLGKLPHTSSALYQYGQNVRLSDLRPGDLVFFRNTYKRGISHVGIYIGRNRFIHASNSRTGVIITPLSDTYYQLRYAGARRLY